MDCEQSKLGGIVRNGAGALGTDTNWSIQGAALGASQFTDEPKRKEEIRRSFRDVAQTVDSGITKAGQVAGTGVNKIVQLSGSLVGEATAAGAKLAGASDQTINMARKIGTVAGSAAIGIAAGMGVASAAVSLAAASGTAGAAATTSGLAALGGGSVAVGAGGMAAGQAVVNTIVSAAAASGAASLEAD